MRYRNLIGPQIRKLRYDRGWSQNVLAAKLQIIGWDIDRVGVAKIESRLVHVDEYELLYFIKVFQVRMMDLFPRIDPTRQLHEVLMELMHRRPSTKFTAVLAGCSQAGTAGVKKDNKLVRNGYGHPTRECRDFSRKE